MNPSRQSSPQARVWPLPFMGCLSGTGLASAVVGAQQNSVHPQPRAEELPGPAMATANPNRRVPQPEGILPKAPAGFSVAGYAELRGPRMMVYAPNGDLFVSSPSTNSIFVLRDANNDGVFEARGVFANCQRGVLGPSQIATHDRDARARLRKGLRNGASDSTRAAGDEGVLAGEIDLHDATIWRSFSTSGAVPQEKVRAPLTRRPIRPLRTLPGPISTYSASGKVVATFLISADQRTGDVSCRSRRSFASTAVVEGSAVTFE